jgi:pantoate kinase
VEVLLGQRQYELHVRRGRLDTVVAQVVGGVVLRHDPSAVDAWVEGLLADLERRAQESDAARAALERLLR